jgi:hypothetical protein
MVSREGNIQEEIIGDMNMKNLSELIDPYFEEKEKRKYQN